MPTRVVALIPARSGSKGVPGKNVRLLHGRPLMDYAIKPALACPLIDAVYVNSDSDEYLALAQSLGARTYKRPAELATDTAAIAPVVKDFHHALEARGERYDAIIVLYPVYPLRTAHELSQIVRAFEAAGGDRPLFGLKPVKTHPFLCYYQDADSGISPVVNFDIDVYYRRQTYPDCFEITYYACMVPTAGIDELNAQLQSSRTAGMRIDPTRIIDIDTPDDFQAAERALASAGPS